MKYTIFFLFAFCITNAQQPRTISKDFHLLGKVKRIVETAEKLGEEFTQKQLEDKNTFYVPTNYNVVGAQTFNELGNILDKQELPNNNEKSIYTYDKSNKISTVTVYFSNVKKQTQTPVSKTKFLYKQDTIIATITRLKDKTEKPLEITRIYKNNQLQSENTEQKSINYFYNDKGTLIKKVGTRKKDDKIKIENYEVQYENSVVISDFCPEKNITKTYYSNGLQKTFVSTEINQENSYTYDQNGNWITNTVSVDGKPITKYIRKITYFE
jgi:hypothetical protein